MAMNIPMPGQPGTSFLEGMGAGSDMFSKLMQPITQRENMARQWAEHKDNLGIQQQAQARAQQEFNQSQSDRAMLDQMMYGNQSQQGQQAPTQEYGQGMGMFTPEGMQDAQQQQQQNQGMSGGGQPGGVNLEALRNSPFGRNLFKKIHGFDPVAEAPQTPEQKNASSLELYRQKKALDAEVGSGKNTNAVITKAQNTINGVVNAIPIIDDLINDVAAGNVPGKFLGGTFKRDQQANYNSNVSESAETLANALGYPNSEGGFKQAEKVVVRGFGESDDNYRRRLIKLKEKMKTRRKNAQSALVEGSGANGSDDFSDGSGGDSDGSIVKNGVTYYPDGQGGWEHD